MTSLSEFLERTPAPPAPLPAERSLAIAYVPFQQTCDMASPEEGFRRGTVFNELYKPFTGKRGQTL